LVTIRRTIYPLFIPALLILLSSAIILKWPDLMIRMNDVRELRAILVLMPFAPYIIFALGFAMGWRYANAGMLLGTLALTLTYFGLDFLHPSDFSREVNPGQSVFYALAFLLPLNLAFYSTLTKRRLLTSVGVFAMVFLVAQIFTVIVFCYPRSPLSLQFMAKVKSLSPSVADKCYGISRWLGTALSDHSFFSFDLLPTAAVFAGGLAVIFVLLLFIKNNDIRVGGFLFAIVAAMLGIATKTSAPAVIFYFIAAGLIMVVTTVEASFTMAYIDELTGLPGRRSLNETMLNLGKKYVIAMIDVDRFKKFNDTYGHKTGDQVLKMIAARLGKISGGAKTFRYGGEEFTAIFSGQSLEDALSHVEDFREAVAATPFVIRSPERPLRRKSGRSKKKASDHKQVKVTVSIGLASPDREITDPEKVIKAADKKLYKAKKGGRNRTEH
jgi:diguanylate cyclase (GGDEF)-like protein